MRHRAENPSPPPLVPCGWTVVHLPHDGCPGLEPPPPERPATYEEMSRWLSNAEERLQLARGALVNTGYFTEDEVSDDVAPRITELWAYLTQHEDGEPATEQPLPPPTDYYALSLEAAKSDPPPGYIDGVRTAAEHLLRLAGDRFRKYGPEDPALVALWNAATALHPDDGDALGVLRG